MPQPDRRGPAQSGRASKFGYVYIFQFGKIFVIWVSFENLKSDYNHYYVLKILHPILSVCFNKPIQIEFSSRLFFIILPFLPKLSITTSYVLAGVRIIIVFNNPNRADFYVAITMHKRDSIDLHAYGAFIATDASLLQQLCTYRIFIRALCVTTQKTLGSADVDRCKTIVDRHYY